MNRGEIYAVTLDPTVGHEQSGTRPVLIISASAFNRATKLPVILPITRGGNFVRRLGLSVPLIGTQTSGIIRCDQPRTLDVSARQGRMIETIPEAILDEVLAKIVTLFE
jgi:mRNA interferase ChpB